MITKELLQEWEACQDGLALFIEHFPLGATLQEISKKCIELNEDGHAIWIFNKCRSLKLYQEETSLGYRNSGDYNSGHHNSGESNSGDNNSGDRNSGHHNSGHHNSGYYNSGDRNSGDLNSGYRNSGYYNSGYSNSGDHNSGDRNSGDSNSGDYNSGDYNSGQRNSGHFNSTSPDVIRVFNKDCLVSTWENSSKPDFIYKIELLYWVSEENLTDEEKKDDPNFYIRGGQLRTRSYKEAWKMAYDSASEEDLVLLKALPNFDKDVFLEITGIEVD